MTSCTTRHKYTREFCDIVLTYGTLETSYKYIHTNITLLIESVGMMTTIQHSVGF